MIIKNILSFGPRDNRIFYTFLNQSITLGEDYRIND